MSLEPYKSKINVRNEQKTAMNKMRMDQQGSTEFGLEPNLSGNLRVTFSTPYKSPPFIHYYLIVKSGGFDVTSFLAEVTEKGFIVSIQNSSLTDSASGTLKWKSFGS